jgi:hypothetical protein
LTATETTEHLDELSDNQRSEPIECMGKTDITAVERDTSIMAEQQPYAENQQD